MFMTISAFVLIGIIYYIASYFVQGLWVYYIPSACLLVLLWLLLVFTQNKNLAKNLLNKYSNLFSIEQREMFLSSPSIFIIKTKLFTLFARLEADAASGYIMFISIGYAIYSIYMQNWLTLAISVFIIIMLFTILSFSFPGSSDDEDFVKVVRRYCRAKKINRKELNKFDLEKYYYHYSEILQILEGLRQGNV